MAPGIQLLGQYPALLLGVAVAGYFLGALPFGYLVARLHGVNIFEQGSRSPGATNVRRILGSTAGNTVFVLDAFKGAFAAGWPVFYFLQRGQAPTAGTAYVASLLGIIGLVCALLGHSYSCFTGFRGGKGVATGVGGLIVLMPYVALVATALWIVLFYASGYVSLGSIFAAASLPVTALLMRMPAPLVALAGVISAFIIIRHRANIVRLLNGTENRFGKSPEKTPKP